MSKTIAQKTRNVFQHQSHPSNRQRPRGGVRQDNYAFESVRIALKQPVRITRSTRTHQSETKNNRSKYNNVPKRQTVLVGSWVKPIVKEELQRIANTEGLSISSVSARALEQWVHWSLHEQHEALAYPMIRKLMRDEFQAFEDRHINFLMRIAIASEQARILITEVLKRLLYLINQVGKLITWLTSDKKQNTQSKNDNMQSTIETFDTIVEKSYDMARANVFRKSTEMKSMLKDYEAWGKGEKIIKST